MKKLTAVGCGALGALGALALVVVAAGLGPLWIPQENTNTTVPTDRIVPGDITFWDDPPAGFKRVAPHAMVVSNDAGDSFFVWWPWGELWQVAPPWCDVVVRRRIVQLEMALAQAHATADSLEAIPDLAPYVGDLCVRVDRLEALAGIGGADTPEVMLELHEQGDR